MTQSISKQAAVVGIGATEFSKESGRSEWRLAVECVKTALDDAGLTPKDVDGVALFTMESNPEIAVARALGIPELKFFSKIPHGGGAAAAPFQQAAMAIALGIAEVVVVYRAFNERSGHRFGSGPPPFAYMHEYGATSEDFGRISVLSRKHAANNPKAWFYERPITLEDHQNSRMIADPLRLLDCCQESDGGQALVVTSVERARDLRQKPAVISAAAQGIGPNQFSMTSYYRDDITRLPEVELVADQLWQQSGLKPQDMDAAILYDAFTPMVMMQLEDYGFCGRGEAPGFVKDGNLELDGQLPVNTHGGQLGEAYIHGVNGVAEGVRLIRGESTNQPDKNVENVLVTGGTAVPHSGLLLATDG